MIEDVNNRYERGIDEWCTLPIFRQSVVILHLVEHIVEGIKLGDQNSSSQLKSTPRQPYTQQMMENAILIPSAIAAAHGVDLYDLKMENATLVRKAARELIQDSKGLLTSGYQDKEYLDVLAEAIETLRSIFLQWVQTFNSSQYINDTWGLFNPVITHTDGGSRIKDIDVESFLNGLDNNDDWDDEDISI